MNKHDLYNLFNDGFEKLRKDKEEKEKDKIFLLRGGSVVALTENGEWIGDPRTALTRYMGLQKRTPYDQNLLFQAGLANEDMIHEYLDAMDVEYRCEEEVPVKFVTPKGREVHGRPDCIIEKDGKPVLLLEYKGIFGSTSCLKNHHAGYGTPKQINMLQCALYAYYWKCKGVVIYTNRSHHKVYVSKRDEAKFKFPNHRSFHKNGKGAITRVSPYQSFYEIEWIEDRLHVDGEPTVIKFEDIMRGYDAVADMYENQVVPPLYPEIINLKGEKERSFGDPNFFYDWKEVDHDDWDSFVGGVVEEIERDDG